MALLMPSEFRLLNDTSHSAFGILRAYDAVIGIGLERDSNSMPGKKQTKATSGYGRTFS